MHFEICCVLNAYNLPPLEEPLLTKDSCPGGELVLLLCDAEARRGGGGCSRPSA